MAELTFDREKIIRIFKEKYSDDGASYISNIFCDQYDEKELKQLLLEQWDELFSGNFDDDTDLDHILYRIHYDINTNALEKSRSLRNVINMALMISAVIFLPVIFYFMFQIYQTTNTKDNLTFVEIHSPAWTRTQFRLPDGTSGWLNSNSSLKYNGDFLSERQVFVSGEIFFDVTTDDKKPFNVITGEASITVLGTRFNIAAYENEDNLEVVLEEGKLIFNDDDMKISYNMTPNEKVIYNKTLQELKLEIVNPLKYTSWTEGMLVLRNDPLDVIARRLERWYNVDVVIEDNLTTDIELRATFFDESLEEVLYLLKRSLNINYTIVDRDLSSGDSYSRKRVIITLPT
jgi:transmembrane sensor